MKEIGGYFGLESFRNGDGEYYKDSVPLNTARNALVYLAKAKSIKKIYIPYLLCDSVSLVCEREGIRYAYYHTDADFRPVFDNVLKEDEYLYVVNLYGQIGNAEISELKNRYGSVIVDNIHAFFQKPVAGIDTIYSCRKFFGVPDGAYLATDRFLREELPTDDSEGRTSHIYGRIKDGASAHYAEFKANDALFKQLPLMKMSALTHRMLSEIEYERIQRIREANYSFLHQKLGGINELRLRMPEVHTRIRSIAKTVWNGRKNSRNKRYMSPRYGRTCRSSAVPWKKTTRKTFCRYRAIKGTAKKKCSISANC